MENARNASIDAAKLLAAFGVVMIHLAPSTSAAELVSRLFLCFAVPFFLAIALYFFIDKVCGIDRLRVFHLRLDRILIPYAVWTIVYLALRLIKYRVQNKLLHLDLVPALFYGGTGVQMYFLPLLLLLEAQALAVLLVLRGSAYRMAGISVLIGAFAFGYFGSRMAYFGFQNSFERGSIYVFFAFFLRFSQSTPFGRRVNVFFGGVIAALTVAATVGDYHADWLNYVGGPLAGYSIAALALNIRLTPARAPWRFVLSCSYGIYLAHFLFLETFQFAASRLGYEIAPYSVLKKALISILISVCCVLLIWFARLHRISASLLLGEAPHRPRVTPLPSPGGPASSMPCATSL